MREYKLEDLKRWELPLLIQRQVAMFHEAIHRHNAVEMVYIKHGSGWCAVDGIVHPMLTGDLYMIPVGATHEFYSDRPLHYINIIFDQRIFQEMEEDLSPLFNRKTSDVMLDKYTFGLDLQPEILKKIDILDQELKSEKKYSRLRCRILLADFLIFVIRHAEFAPGIRASHAQKHLGNVLSYISDHLGEKLSVKELAEISGYQPDYFGKFFRREVGTGISEYISIRRVEAACYELTHTDHTMDEIALQTGFFDTSYFIKIFKKHCGMTPAQFRRNHLKKT